MAGRVDATLEVDGEDGLTLVDVFAGGLVVAVLFPGDDGDALAAAGVLLLFGDDGGVGDDEDDFGADLAPDVASGDGSDGREGVDAAMTIAAAAAGNGCSDEGSNGGDARGTGVVHINATESIAVNTQRASCGASCVRNDSAADGPFDAAACFNSS